MKFIRKAIAAFILLIIMGTIWSILLQYSREKKAFREAQVLCTTFNNSKAEEAKKFFQENKDLFIPALIKIAKDENQKVKTRGTALLYIGENRDKVAVGPLCELLSDSNWEIRFFSSQALGKIQDKHAVERLCKAWLNEDSKKVREEIAVSLMKIGDKKAIPVFLKTLKDSEKDIHILSALTLYKLSGNSDYFDIIKKAVNDEKYEVRGKTIAILGRMILEEMESPEIISLVEKALNDKDPRLRKIAQMFIEEIKDQRK